MKTPSAVRSYTRCTKCNYASFSGHQCRKATKAKVIKVPELV